MPEPASLIAADWGTSAFRAYLIAADGDILARTETADGILAATAAGFAAVLERAVDPWRAAHGRLPILMSGMIGSRQGWVEAPYLACPADAAGLAAALCHVDHETLSPLAIVPGLSTFGANQIPDVMRGEETQIIGTLALTGRRDGTFLLPGTHSKWASVEDGGITAFATYMTGETFAALRLHTILGRLAEGDLIDGRGFDRGVAAARSAPASPGSLLNLIFSARALALFDRLAPGEVGGYLSGLLIGAELAAAAPPQGKVTIVGSAALSHHYRRAAAALGLDVDLAPDDCVVAGHLAIAQVARLLKEPIRARP